MFAPFLIQYIRTLTLTLTLQPILLYEEIFLSFLSVWRLFFNSTYDDNAELLCTKANYQ
jgi:hypothetical protein